MLSQIIQQLKRNALFWISIILLMVSWIGDLLYLQPLLINPIPQLEAVYLLRSALLMMTAGLFVLSQLSRAHPDRPLPSNSSHWLLQVAPWISLALGVASLVLFLISPRLFTSAGDEDRPVEYLSAIGQFVAAGLLVVVAARLFKKVAPYKRGLLLVCLMMAGGFFVIGMEEVSWFQRVIGFDTPEGFVSNRQGEFNLHNFASNLFEEFYYLSGFCLLILLPFLAEVLSLHERFQPVRWLVPGSVVLFSGALMAAFNYHLWNRTSTQFVYFVTLFILLYYARRSFQQNGTRLAWLLPSSLLLVFIAAQALFLLRGHTLPIPWQVSEYKELLLPIGFSVYALEVVLKSHSLFLVSEPALKSA